jgi:hypothetical protein
MPKAYSRDLRERVIAAVETGASIMSQNRGRDAPAVNFDKKIAIVRGAH